MLRIELTFPKPHSPAIVSRLFRLSSSRRRAASTRRRSTNFAGVVFISLVKTRAKLRGLIPTRCASTGTLSGLFKLSSTQDSSSNELLPGGHRANLLEQAALHRCKPSRFAGPVRRSFSASARRHCLFHPARSRCHLLRVGCRSFHSFLEKFYAR